MAVCYFCEREGNEDEHVPPRCFFPEQKDLPPGIDLRKSLITVPACADHNSKKSSDDEYLLYVFVINLPVNTIAQNHFSTKLVRAIQRNPSLIKKFTAIQQPVVTEDTKTGEVQHTIAVRIDQDRFDRTLGLMARALYFHHFKQRWTGTVSIRPDFLLSLSDSKAREHNALVEKMAKAADDLFINAATYGENPEVFKYQFANGGAQCHKLARLYFYEGCKVTVLYGPIYRIETSKNKTS